MSPETKECFEIHKQLGDHTAIVYRRLGTLSPDEADLLRLGASCLKSATYRAITAANEREAVRSWIETEVGECQIRSATYSALRKGQISNLDYDTIFALAASAFRVRQDELARLRRHMQTAAFQ